MSSEAITKNDLTNILNEIAVSPAGSLVGEDTNGDIHITNDINAGGDISVTGDVYAGGQKVRSSVRVFSGGLFMTTSHTVEWTDDGLWSSISLVWSGYTSTVQNYQWEVYTVPRAFIAAHNGVGHTIFMGGSKFYPMGCKYVYIYLDHIGGNDDNDDTGTASSAIKFANNNYVLREVWLNY